MRILNHLPPRLKEAILALFALFSPLQATLWATFCLVVLDLITGVLAAHKRKEPIESNKLKKTVVKLLVYQLTIIVSYVTMLYLTGQDIPILKIVTSIIGLTELRSVLENLTVITNNNIFRAITGALPTAKQSDNLDKGEL